MGRSLDVYEKVYPAASGPMDRPTMYNVRRSHGEPGPAKVLAPYWAQSHSASLGLFIRSLALLFLLLFLLLLSSPRRPGELLKLYSRALKQRKRHKNNTTLLPGRQYEGRFHHRSCPPSLSLSLFLRAQRATKRGGCCMTFVKKTRDTFTNLSEPEPE